MGLLYRYFLRSFFESDLVARDGDPRSQAILAAAFFAAPGLMVCMYLSMFAGHADTTPEVAFFVALGMILSGLLAVLEWDEMFPGRTDILVLRPLPVPLRTMLGAKLAAVATLMTGFAVIVNLYSNLLLPMMSVPDGRGLVYSLRLTGAQMAATGGASIWLFLVVLGVRGAALVAGAETGWWQAGPLLRFGLMVALLAALILSPNLTSPAVFAQVVTSSSLLLRPLQWFVGLDKWLAGVPGWAGLGRDALRGLGITTAAALALYGLGCQRRMRTALAAARGRRWMHDGWGVIVRAWAWAPREAAVLAFALATLARSRQHRLYLSTWIGLGTAFVLEGAAGLAWHGGTSAARQTAMLAAPLVLGFFLLVGLRHVFTIPVELRANWIFRLSETGAQPERFAAAPKLMLALGVVPVGLAALGFSAWQWGWRRGGLHAAATAVLLGLLLEALLLRFRKLPFTCAYVPGKSNAKVLWVVYWLGFTLYAYGMAEKERELWLHPARLLAWLAGGGMIIAALAHERRRWRRSLPGAQFDDGPEALIQTLFERD